MRKRFKRALNNNTYCQSMVVRGLILHIAVLSVFQFLVLEKLGFETTDLLIPI